MKIIKIFDNKIIIKKKFNDNKIITLFFIREKTNDELIFHIDKFINLKRLCIPQSFIKKMFNIVYNENHSNFEKCYEIISKS